MQDLTAIAQNLGQIAAAFKLGGTTFLIGCLGFLIYKIVVILSKRPHRATQDVHVSVGGDKGPGTGKVCPLHSGVEAKIEAIVSGGEQSRVENAKAHDKLFDKLDVLNNSVINLAASNAASALAAANATYSQNRPKK